MFHKSLLARGAKLTLSLAGAALVLSTVATAAPVSRGAAARPVQRQNKVVGPNATTTLYSGGATLPAIAYLGTTEAATNPGVVPGTGTAGSVFGYFFSLSQHSSFSDQYCQTGSGFGKKVLDGSVAANIACAALGATPTGFGAATAVADFAGSDSPVSGSEYTTFNTNEQNSSNPIFGRGEFVQVPYIAGAVAIFYNNSDVSSQLGLTPSTLCKIADGEINNWNQVPKNPANPNGPFFPSKTLKWVYRADSSGTTFSFSNYVSSISTSSGTRNNCKGSGETYALNSVYDPKNTSVSPAPSSGVLPLGTTDANFLAANLNPGVVECILGTANVCTNQGSTTLTTGGDGSIGYVEAANALANRNGASQDFAKLRVTKNGVTTEYDPITDLPAAADTVSRFVVDLVVGAFVANGRPTGGPSGNPDLAALPNTPVKAKCLGIVDPQTYSSPSRGYPIMAVTNLEFSLAGNGTKAATLQALGKFTNSKTNFGTGKITSVDLYGTSSNPVTGTTGYSAIPLNSSNNTENISTLVRNCIGA